MSRARPQGAEKALAALKTAMTAFGAGIVSDDVRKVFADVNGNVEKYAEAYHKAAKDAHEVEVLANGEMAKEAQAIAAAARASRNPASPRKPRSSTRPIDLIASTEQPDPGHRDRQPRSRHRCSPG